MKHALKLSFSISIVVCMIFLASNVIFCEPAIASAAGPSGPPASDQPPDRGRYNRRAIPQDNIAQPLLPRIRVRDIVVSNTDPNLTNTDMVSDTEPSIAIDPTVTDQMVILAFAERWGSGPDGPAPLWYSGDGGITWTKKFSIPPPPNVAEAPGCPCDQTVDYGRGSVLYGTFLTARSETTANVYSGSTTKPLRLSFWNWWLAPDGTAQRTNLYGFNNTDQPWVLINRDPDNINQDNVYVGYDDFLDRNQRVSAAVPASNPPVFTRDNSTSGGVDCCGINPGHRLAVNPNNGYIYSIFQVYRAAGSGGSANIDFMLNRSTNGGAIWGVNGSPGGIVIANADSTQPTPKFGTVNALLGGVDHVAVDPTTGDVYYVYGNRDPGTGNNRLSVARIQDNGAGGMTVLSTSFVTGPVQAALPSVAVNSTGVVGVLYDTFDGFSGGPPPNYPIFTAHFSVSTDHGATFSDNILLTFLSPALDCCTNPDPDNCPTDCNKQRILGDYQQCKAVGADFVGVFSGTGASFGRTLINMDPIFFRVTLL